MSLITNTLNCYWDIGIKSIVIKHNGEAPSAHYVPIGKIGCVLVKGGRHSNTFHIEIFLGDESHSMRVFLAHPNNESEANEAVDEIINLVNIFGR